MLGIMSHLASVSSCLGQPLARVELQSAAPKPDGAPKIRVAPWNQQGAKCVADEMMLNQRDALVVRRYAMLDAAL
jgi:hypothetical protein